MLILLLVDALLKSLESVTPLQCCHGFTLLACFICNWYQSPSVLSVPNLYISNIASTLASCSERVALSFVARRSFQSLATFLTCNL